MINYLKEREVQFTKISLAVYAVCIIALLIFPFVMRQMVTGSHRSNSEHRVRADVEIVNFAFSQGIEHANILLHTIATQPDVQRLLLHGDEGHSNEMYSNEIRINIDDKPFEAVVITNLQQVMLYHSAPIPIADYRQLIFMSVDASLQRTSFMSDSLLAETVSALNGIESLYLWSAIPVIADGNPIGTVSAIINIADMLYYFGNRDIAVIDRNGHVAFTGAPNAFGLGYIFSVPRSDVPTESFSYVCNSGSELSVLKTYTIGEWSVIGFTLRGGNAASLLATVIAWLSIAAVILMALGFEILDLLRESNSDDSDKAAPKSKNSTNMKPPVTEAKPFTTETKPSNIDAHIEKAIIDEPVKDIITNNHENISPHKDVDHTEPINPDTPPPISEKKPTTDLLQLVLDTQKSEASRYFISPHMKSEYGMISLSYKHVSNAGEVILAKSTQSTPLFGYIKGDRIELYPVFKREKSTDFVKDGFTKLFECDPVTPSYLSDVKIRLKSVAILCKMAHDDISYKLVEPGKLDVEIVR